MASTPRASISGCRMPPPRREPRAQETLLGSIGNEGQAIPDPNSATIANGFMALSAAPVATTADICLP